MAPVGSTAPWQRRERHQDHCWRTAFLGTGFHSHLDFQWTWKKFLCHRGYDIWGVEVFVAKIFSESCNLGMFAHIDTRTFISDAIFPYFSYCRSYHCMRCSDVIQVANQFYNHWQWSQQRNYIIFLTESLEPAPPSVLRYTQNFI